MGESAGNLYQIISQKRQNDREKKWNMIDSSFMTTLPDSWAISKRFIILPINRWEDSYERVFLGGLTCDSDDYYNLSSTPMRFTCLFLVIQNLYIGFQYRSLSRNNQWFWRDTSLLNSGKLKHI